MHSILTRHHTMHKHTATLPTKSKSKNKTSAQKIELKCSQIMKQLESARKCAYLCQVK